MHATQELLAALPAEIVTTDPEILAGYLTDFRRQLTGASPALLRPRNTEEVALVVRLAATHGVALVPQGGNTGYCTAATPGTEGNEVLLSLERMTGLRDIDPVNLSLTVEAGAILSEVQAAAEAQGLLVPLSLGSQQSCRIGGNLSTNAGGVQVLRYGMAREMVLGLEVVLADGSVLNTLQPLRKNNAGYDVKQIFLGAEGTLGIITAASLRLMRQPKKVVTALLALEGTEAMGAILGRAQEITGEQVTSFEYISAASMELYLAANPTARRPLEGGLHHVLIEAATASPVLDLEGAMAMLLEALFEEGLVTDGVVAASEQQRRALWDMRENIPEAETHHGGSIKHDVSVRSSRLSEFITRASALVLAEMPGARLSVYGHVGDGNVHFNVLAGPGPDESKGQITARLSPAIHALAVEMGGSFSAEYGIGRIKRDLLAQYGDPAKIDIMRRIKAVMDPAGLLNPGKVIPPLRG